MRRPACPHPSGDRHLLKEHVRTPSARIRRVSSSILARVRGRCAPPQGRRRGLDPRRGEHCLDGAAERAWPPLLRHLHSSLAAAARLRGLAPTFSQVSPPAAATVVGPIPTLPDPAPEPVWHRADWTNWYTSRLYQSARHDRKRRLDPAATIGLDVASFPIALRYRQQRSTTDSRSPSSVPTLVIGPAYTALSTAGTWPEGRSCARSRQNRSRCRRSGSACGIVRNNYFQPAMQELDGRLRGRSGSPDPEALHYLPKRLHRPRPAARERPHSGLRSPAADRYPSESCTWASRDVGAHIARLYGDCAPRSHRVPHEQPAAATLQSASMHGLADKARAAGAEIHRRRVRDFELDDSGAATRVITPPARLEVDQVVVAVGP